MPYSSNLLKHAKIGKSGFVVYFPIRDCRGLIRVLLPYSMYSLSTRALIHIIRRTEQQKELKRLAKLQIHPGGAVANPMASGATPTTAAGTPQPMSATPFVVQPQPVHAPPPGAFANARKMTGGGTPKPSAGTPRPSSRATNATPGLSNTATPSAGQAGTAGNLSGVPRPGVARPRSAVPRPGSTVPRPGSAVSANKQVGAGLQQQRTGTPAGARPSTPMDVDSGQRGKKRERDDSLPNGGAHAHGNPHAANNGLPNGNGYANGAPNGGMPPRPGIMNAKAGTGNIRPRPIKKQRMVSSLLFDSAISERLSVG